MSNTSFYDLLLGAGGRVHVVSCALELLARGYMPKTTVWDDTGNAIEKDDHCSAKDKDRNPVNELADWIEEALNGSSEQKKLVSDESKELLKKELEELEPEFLKADTLKRGQRRKVNLEELEPEFLKADTLKRGQRRKVNKDLSL